jgi:CRP-like cAMP-binding protein
MPSTTSHVPWLSRLSAKGRHILDQLGRVESFEANCTVVERGATDTHLLLIEDGEAEIRREVAPPIILGRGDLVGELAFLHSAPREHHSGQTSRPAPASVWDFPA